jgi:hypothetical protein
LSRVLQEFRGRTENCGKTVCLPQVNLAPRANAAKTGDPTTTFQCSRADFPTWALRTRLSELHATARRQRILLISISPFHFKAPGPFGMAAPPSQPPARGGMSLYANLLETDSSASISRDPVLFKDDKEDAPAKKAIDPGTHEPYPHVGLVSHRSPSPPLPTYPPPPTQGPGKTQTRLSQSWHRLRYRHSSCVNSNNHTIRFRSSSGTKHPRGLGRDRRG